FTDHAQYLSEFGGGGGNGNGTREPSRALPQRPDGAKPYLAPLRFDRANGRFAAYNGDAETRGALALAEPDRPRPLAAVPASPPKVGAVLIVPTAVSRKELTSVTDLLTLANWPLLGVVTYRRGRFLSRRRAAPDRGAAP